MDSSLENIKLPKIGRRNLLRGRAGERGAVLAIGLVVLLVLTLLGTSSISNVTFEEKMTANVQSLGMAFEGAEAGLVQCETFIRTNTFSTVDQNAVAVNEHAGGDASGASARWWESFDWAADALDFTSEGYDTFTTEADSNYVGLAEEPSCVIEYIGEANPSLEFAEAVTTDSAAAKQVYRVTGFSFGADTRSQAIVESVYAR